MRTKLTIALSALVMVAMMFVTSCSKGGGEPTPTPSVTIPTEFKDISLGSDYATKNIQFTATTNWSITLVETTKAEPSWLDVSKRSGEAGSVEIWIDVEKNTTDKERSSNVIINAGGEPYTISIKQEAGEKEPTPVAVTGVTLNKTALPLVVGAAETLTATIAPEKADNKAVTWKSSDTSVATVVNGKVTALKAGPATITVTTADGGKTATCAVTVTAASVAVTGVTLNKTALHLVVGAAETLTATIAPTTATNKNVTWKSSDPSVATVVNGKVTALKVGTATITVTTEDGAKTATCEVTVPDHIVRPVSVTGVALSPTSITLEEGEAQTLTATISPMLATNKDVTWKSSDTSVATVVDGKVTAISAGPATITVTTEDGAKTATCAVTVTAPAASVVPVEKVELNWSRFGIADGGKGTLVATITPSTATNKNVTWKSSDTSVATIDANGVVTGIKAGQVTITVTTEDGGKEDECLVDILTPIGTTPPDITGGEI